MSAPSAARTSALTTGALVAFAANSVFCRLALADRALDPATYTSVRFGTGALVLLLVARLTRGESGTRGASWRGAAALGLYAVPFSLAYLSLTTGTGALILFGAVQLTMIAAGLRAGERPSVLEWSGLAVALIGLIVLVLPGLSAPSPIGAVLMATAGFGWGLYSLLGRGGGDPLLRTTGSFVRLVPVLLVCSIVGLPWLHVSPLGLLWAALSGTLATGLGYVTWYAALKGLTATRAAIVQLAVPVIAAGAGVVALHEKVDARLVIASVAILGGVGLAIQARRLARPALGSR